MPSVHVTSVTIVHVLISHVQIVHEPSAHTSSAHKPCTRGPSAHMRSEYAHVNAHVGSVHVPSVRYKRCTSLIYVYFILNRIQPELLKKNLKLLFVQTHTKILANKVQILI